MTIEKLADEMRGGFERVDKKFDEFAGMVQRGFEGVNERFDKVEGRLGDVDNKLDAIEIEILDIKKKIDNVIYRHEFEVLKDRVAHLEKLLTAKRGR